LPATINLTDDESNFDAPKKGLSGVGRKDPISGSRWDSAAPSNSGSVAMLAALRRASSGEEL
jgi:hypothetical protein